MIPDDMTQDGVEMRPVFDKHGATVLYDIYIDEEWYGSRRTKEQCQARALAAVGAKRRGGRWT